MVIDGQPRTPCQSSQDYIGGRQIVEIEADPKNVAHRQKLGQRTLGSLQRRSPPGSRRVRDIGFILGNSASIAQLIGNRPQSSDQAVDVVRPVVRGAFAQRDRMWIRRPRHA